MAADPSQPIGPEWSFFASTRTESEVREIHGVTVALPTLAPSSVDWSREIVLAGAADLWISSLRFLDGNLYIAGGVSDQAKVPVPSSGGYWSSGLAASLTTAGEIRWITKAPITDNSDGFSQVVSAVNGVYFVGQCSQYVQQGQYFGYGWLAKIAGDTGAAISHMTFGGDTYGSGFNDAFVEGVEGNVIRCGGWTHQEISGANPAWLCEVDINAP
jgi:hypothetical protein